MRRGAGPLIKTINIPAQMTCSMSWQPNLWPTKALKKIYKIPHLVSKLAKEDLWAAAVSWHDSTFHCICKLLENVLISAIFANDNGKSFKNERKHASTGSFHFTDCAPLIKTCSRWQWHWIFYPYLQKNIKLQKADNLQNKIFKSKNNFTIIKLQHRINWQLTITQRKRQSGLT